MTAVQKRRATDLDPTWSERQLVRARTVLGQSATAWAGEGAVTIEDGRWRIATSAASVDLNIALCHGSVGAQLLAVTVQDILESAKPAILMVAGDALANVQRLAELHWVCVGSAPAMAYEFGDTQFDADVRMLNLDELTQARRFVEERFELSPQFAEMALPTNLAGADPRSAAWGLFDQGQLVSSAVAVIIGDVAAIWWMATPSSRLRRGYGRRLLAGVFNQAQLAGATSCVLHASPSGTPFYRSIGFQVLEVWQLWSRPRWVLGRD